MASRRRVPVIAALLLILASSQQAQAEQAEPAAEPDDASGVPVLVMLIGGGARFRNIHLELGSGGSAETRSFETGAYFEFAWHLFVRPMSRRSPRAAVQAIAFQIDGGSGIGLNVQPSGSGIELQTNAWRMVGQFGYLYPIDRLQVGGLVGIGGDVLTIDLNSVLPSSRIIYVRVGPAVAYEIIRGFLDFRADFGVRAPFYYGELKDAFGSDASGVGLDGTLTFQGRIKAGFTYGARFVWEYYRLRFAGPTQNVPAMGAGGEGKDHAMTVQLLLGWSL